MPDGGERLAVSAVRATGRWCRRSVGGEVTLFLEHHEVVVRVDTTGEELAAALTALHGASWRTGVLTLYLADDELQLQAAEGLDRAWHTLTQRACALPEVTRGLRGLATPYGAWVDSHARYFAPLLQARRRLEGDEPMDWKVAGFDTAVLAERMRAVLAALALERYASRPPYRRALEAGLLHASEPMFQQMERLALAARAVHEGDDARRFVEWRTWAAEVRALFVDADRSWSATRIVLAEEDRRHLLPRE